MARPYRLYGPRWDLPLTPSMAADIRLAAAAAGIARIEWVRRACEEKLARGQEAVTTP